NCEHYQNHDNWHGWVPDADYFGPVWVEGVGWVVPQGWEAPHGWASPPGWHDHDHRSWNDHDGDHRARNDHDHRAWNDHDGDDRARNDHDHRAWNDHDHDDRARNGHDHRARNDHDDDDGDRNDHDGDHRTRNDQPQHSELRHHVDGRGTTHALADHDSRVQTQHEVERGSDSGRTGHGVPRSDPGYQQHGQSLGGLQSGPANPVAAVAPAFFSPAQSFSSDPSLSNGASVGPNVTPVATAPAVATTTAAASVAPVNATPVDPKSSTGVASE